MSAGAPRTQRRRAATAQCAVAPASRLLAPAVGLLLALAGARSAAIDLAALWDFSQPALSEQRFREALQGTRGDDALILHTQIARTHGLRRDFATARGMLRDLEPRIERAGLEARTRYWLELGRTYASAAHAPATQTTEALAAARTAFGHALATARAGQLDGLAVDALHMMAFVETAPADQLKWGQAALAEVEASSQPAAKAWEASIRNNVGYALHELGRPSEALQEFERALALRERGSSAQATRVARWMVAWTLRALQRVDEAIAIQLGLEQEWQSAGQADPHVFEELEQLYRAKGDAARARHYATLHKAHSK